MAPSPIHTYLISDLVTNATLAELPLTGVRYSKRLGDAGQLSATLTLEDPRIRITDPYDLTTPTRRVVYVLRDDVPMWGGLIWTRRYDSSSRQVSLGCGDFWSYFDHRKVLPVLTEQAYQDQRHVATLTAGWEGTDQNQIARDLVALAQSHPGGDIGILTASDPSSSGIPRDRHYAGHQNVETGDALRQLAEILDGPDMMFDVGPIDVSGRPTRLLRLGTPRLGRRGSPHVWEFGGNLLSYVWPSDGTRMATRTFAVGEGTGTGMLIAVAEDRGAYQRAWPLLEAEGGYGSVADAAQLQAHAQADQQAGRLPVVLPTLRIDGRVPPTTGEIGVGDDARVIIEDEFHSNGVDTAMRIVGIDVAIDNDGGEDVTLTMNPLLEDVA